MFYTQWTFWIIVGYSLCVTSSDTDSKSNVAAPVLTNKQVLLKWQSQSCTQLKKLIQRKATAVSSVNAAIKDITKDNNIPNDEKQLHVARFDAFVSELDETEHLIVSSLEWLNNVLAGNYKDYVHELQNSKKRLELLRGAVLREEQEYQTLFEAEEELKLVNGTRAEGMMDGILKNVAKAADQLEDELDDHAFDNALKDPANGGSVEAVLKIKEVDEDAQTKNKSEKNTEEGVMRLVDVQDNQYTMSKGKDTTVPHEDHMLIRDLVMILVLSFVLGTICSTIQLPSMFGYILAGLILGPSGMNMLKSLVQIETLGEFGVFFIMFAVGLEFSPDKIKKVFKVAVIGCTLVTGLMIGGGVCIGAVMGAGPHESSFVSACFSLSSTPLIVRFLSVGSGRSDEDGHVDYSLVLLGILIMQDIFLGLLMAMLPSMAIASVSEGSTDQLAYSYIAMIGRIALGLISILVLGYIVSKIIVGPLYRRLFKKDNKELIIMASTALTFCMLTTTNYLKISMELGCFIAGVTISAQGHDIAERVEHINQPLKDFLSCIFFASIGLHVFPTFMLYQVTYLTIFTVITVAAKFLFSVLILTILLPHSSRHIKWVVSAGLAQVSEFSFVLSSRARRLGLISRETYLLILSITTLSLLLAPLLWKISVRQLRLKQYASWGAIRSDVVVELRDINFPSDSTKHIQQVPTNQEMK